MRNKVLFFVTIFLIFAGSIKSQDPYKFVPIKFLDYTPKWFFYVEDSTAIGESSVDHYDYISQFVHVNSIVRDSFLYSLYRTRLKCMFDGLYVEKRNVNTGKRIWSYLHDLRDGGNNEIPKRMIFNEKGDLEIVGYRTIDRKINVRFPNKQNKLALRIINPDTGEVVDSVFSKVKDTLAITMYRDHPLYKLNFSSEIDSIRYQYIFNYSKATGYDYNNVTAYTLDVNGHLLEEKVASFDSISPNTRIAPLTLLEDNTFISTRHVYNEYSRYDEKYEYRYFIDKYDRDMNILNSAEITEVLNAKNDYRLNLKYVDNDMIIFKYINEPEFWNWKTYYYIFDHYGNLLDSVNTYPDDADDFYIGTIQRISQDEFLIAGVNLDAVDRDFTLYFYKKKIGQPLKLAKKIKLGPNYYFPGIESIKMLDNGDFLMQGATGPKIGHVGLIKWPFWMYIRAKDLEGGVGIEEVESQVPKARFAIYPNPTSEKLNIKFKNPFSGEIEIIDEIGRLVIRKKIKGKREVELDISTISKGFYFVRALGVDVTYKSLWFMRE